MLEINSGAEAKIYFDGKNIIKERVSKKYRHPVLDKKLIKTRNKKEANLLKKVKALSLNAPSVFLVSENKITMEKIENTNKHSKLLETIGAKIAKLHNNGIIHGDLNLINLLTTKENEIYFIDFGLGFLSNKIEDKATDLLVFKKTLKSSKKTEKYWEKILEAYKEQTNEPKIIAKIQEIEKRARYL